jgi:hypothetical protein
MATTESPNAEQLEPKDEREDALNAYLMTKTFLVQNGLLGRGVQLLDSDGDPVHVTYMSEAQILHEVTKACGDDMRVTTAIEAAYDEYYKPQLVNRSES